MKNLLYTLLLGLVIISCQKEDMGSGNAPLALSDVEIVQDNNKIIDWILSNLESTKTDAQRGDNANTSKGSDYINVGLFTEGNFTYMVLTDESNDDLCNLPDGITTLFFDNSSNDGSILTVEDEDEAVIRSIRGNFSGFFSLPQNSITQLSFDANSDLIIGDAITFDSSNSATFTN